MQTLLSVMNEKNPISCIRRGNIQNSYIIINQITKKSIAPVNHEDDNGKVLSVYDRGLSKSRNLALDNANDSGIAILADDDMAYVDNCEEIVEKAYKQFPEASVIGFNVNYKHEANKKQLREGKLSYRDALTLNSVRISFRLDMIKKYGIRFDEKFGAGTRNIMGEDNIFIRDCLKKGLLVYYSNQTIGTLNDMHESSWFTGYDQKYFMARGAMLFRLSPVFCRLFILRFALLKYNLYKNSISLWKAIKYMNLGRKEMRRLI